MAAGERWTVDASVALLSTKGLSGALRTPPFENLRYEDRA
jgi:hypothetical protein